MSIYDTLNFQPMLITDVFESMAASKAWYDKSALRTSGVSSYPFVSRTKADNGVDGFCSRQEKDPEAGNAITIGLDTQTVGFQPVAFYTSQNIQVLRHPNLTPATAAVLMPVIKTQLRKFSWGGNGATLGRLKATKIMIPTTFDDSGETVVDWDGISEFGRELFAEIHTHRARPSVTNHVGEPPELTFEPMLITDVFESMAASKAWYDKNKVVSSAGQFAYVSRSAMANGLEDVIGKQSLPPNPAHAITIGVDTQTVFYQPMPFYTSVKIQVLRHHRLNELTGPVLVTLLRQQMGKFQWGNGASLVRLKATKIMVPVTVSSSGETVVDWDGIDCYGRWLIAQIDKRKDSALPASVINITPPQPELANERAESHPSSVCDATRQRGTDL